jgi:hypothetical protein
MNSVKRFQETPWPAIFLAAGVGIWGLGWGLPSPQRNRLFLKPELQTPAFYQSVEKTRDDRYTAMGMNPISHLGRITRTGASEPGASGLLSSYSSFLVRTHHGDEQQALVMISRLNPFKGRWYPYTFQYGGAYVLPLAAYLGALHAVRLITLVPQASFYYAQPEKIAGIYWAVRAWSVLGLMLAAAILFYIGRRIGGAPLGFWASGFFALLPASIGNAKLAKPHTWAAAWVLLMVFFCLKAKDDARLRNVLWAAIAFGIGIGTALSQIIFFPFLVWACWTADPRKTVQRLAAAGGAAAAAFIASNFYIVNHFQDYRDEVYYFKQYYPFGVHLRALWDFLYGVLRVSFGVELWGLAWIAGGLALFQRPPSRLRVLTGLSLIAFVYVAFQTQSQPQDAAASRLCLAALGLLCVVIAGFLRKLPKANTCCGIVFGILFVKAAVYDLHFSSDRAPRDNASLAALWIQDHVPNGASLGHAQAVPHVIEFPPVDFSRYALQSLDALETAPDKGPDYAVVPDWARTDQKRLEQNRYTRVKRFAESPLQKLGYQDPFTTANFALNIYKKAD